MNALLKGLALMTAMMSVPADTKHDERGAAFTEYVVLVAAVVLAFAGLLITIGPVLVAKLTTVVNGI